MNNKLMPVFLLAGAFFVLALWRNPAVAAEDVSHVIGNIWGFLEEVFTKVIDFLGGLGS